MVQHAYVYKQCQICRTQPNNLVANAQDDGGPAIGNVSLLLDALSEDEAEMVMVDEQLGATSEVGPVEGLNAAATGGLLSDESDRKRKREEAEASAKEEKDKALRAECIQKRVLLDDTVIKVQAAVCQHGASGIDLHSHIQGPSCSFVRPRG